MAVNLVRPHDPIAGQETLASFGVYISLRVFDSYCSAAQYRNFVEYGMANTGHDRKPIEHSIDLELERMGAANEQRLLEELDAALRRFTASDRKLDDKEKSDALQLVCKSRPGFRFGLRPETAEATILAYCRTNGVKQKSGWFAWAIP